MDPVDRFAAANKIHQVLANFPPNERGRVLRTAIEMFTPDTAGKRRSNTTCDWCGKDMRRRSSNQRYCSYACGREVASKKRLETTALQFEMEVLEGRYGSP